MATSGGESEKDADVPNGHPSADGDHSMKQVVSNLPPLQQSQREEKGKMCE